MLDKIIGIDKGTRERSVAFIITTITDFLAVFDIIHFTDAQVNAIIKLVVMLVSVLIYFYCFYKNSCHTEANLRATEEARQRNLELDPEYAGERFFDDITPVDDVEDEDEE